MVFGRLGTGPREESRSWCLEIYIFWHRGSAARKKDKDRKDSAKQAEAAKKAAAEEASKKAAAEDASAAAAAE